MNWSIRLLIAAAVALTLLPADVQAKKKIVFVAGGPSHGFGSHEHYAGSVLLAKGIQNALPEVETVVYRNGWPKQENAFEGADAVVMYSDGGGGHPANPHLEQLLGLAEQGVGMVCIHYAVEVPKGKPGDAFLQLIGGYFETNWSVNPHWTAEFDEFPEHPITRGVKPFSMNDEWYYHMRFPEGMKGVTPILTDLPPKETLNRRDGAHSGNPHVRKAVLQEKAPQHVAWAYEGVGEHRGFGFTGGHFHWNWGDENFRRTVLNGIAWSAKIEVPQEGLPTKPVTVEGLLDNQDEKTPGNFKSEDIRKRFNLQGSSDKAKPNKALAQAKGAKPVAKSKLITANTKGHSEELTADIEGAKKLFLVVTDGGDGFSCDWAAWAQPRLIGPSGEKKLTELKWKTAVAGHGKVNIDRNAGGQAIRINNEIIPDGIGTHANSVIEYNLPEGYEQFKATVGLDNGGTDQGCGSTVQFMVFTETPPASILAARTNSGGGGSSSGSHEVDEAVAGLDIAEGLEATLFAAEPNITSVTNLDVDHRGRVWVCEVMNYRRNNGTRPEGDRILILEDTDGDGRSDKQTVFYQGRDIDSAMGICVLDNKVIVSAAPYVWVLTDEDRDGKADKKEALFTNTGQPQHDHSAHSFLFGPDGKLYWNVGNTGKHVHDAEGKIVVDMAGNEVRDNGNPYFGGMPFRCNLDGSEFEVLGHNFRNNYEVTVDSFGTLWQSDNDDDGNKGVRINYVMEFGNYGYRDQMTGAGWKSPRTGMSDEIPLRHWHLNDPGVVPNLLQTGAGSPCGITVYEGRLLPEVFWDQVIHADAGPNVVRAYPATKDGAGYTATIENVAFGARDNWFRPADVAVAPDGSLFITDWYDPGVGGHAQRDLDRGRVFRIAPPGSKYSAPEYDYSTADGAAQALTNPASSVRYMAWKSLEKMGSRAEEALVKLYQSSENPRHRVRSLWALAKLTENGARYVHVALGDDNADIRVAGIRMARQLKLDLPTIVKGLVRDPAVEVRRECAIALRFLPAEEAAPLWVELALQHDGEDRWYLEALGIGSDLNADACFEALMAKVGDKWNTAAGRDLIWRSRSADAMPLLAQLIVDPDISPEEQLRYFRAFDFHAEKDAEAKQAKQAALLSILAAAKLDQEQTLKLTLERLGKINYASAPTKLKEVIDETLSSTKGTSEFVGLVDQFQVKDRYEDLVALATEKPDEQAGVDAAALLVKAGGQEQLKQHLAAAEVKSSSALARAMGNTGDGNIVKLLMPIVNDADADLELRRQATQAVAKTQNGAERIIELAKANKLAAGLKPAAATLNSAQWNDIRVEAAKLFPLPPPRGGEALPPIPELVKQRGDIELGREIFAKVGQCAKCHRVGEQGKQVGPDLDGIGSKLSKPAFYESILFPSAGVSHSYETYAFVLSSGNVVNGLLVSETDEGFTIKNSEGLEQKIAKADVDQWKKLDISLMPSDLQKQMTKQELIDVVEYLTTLKKK